MSCRTYRVPPEALPALRSAVDGAPGAVYLTVEDGQVRALYIGLCVAEVETLIRRGDLVPCQDRPGGAVRPLHAPAPPLRLIA